MSGLSAQIERKGSTYYVQTQDVGTPSDYIESLIYRSGKLLTSRKTMYTSYLGRPNSREHIAKLMQDQHDRIIHDISEGKFDHFLAAGEK